MKARSLMPMLVLGLSACATHHSKYDWGNYTQTLVAVQEDPATGPVFARALAKIIANPRGHVPPGIYAEYGYVLQQEGQRKAAIDMYERERLAWPESTLLMNKMIAGMSTATGPKVGDAAPLS